MRIEKCAVLACSNTVEIPEGSENKRFCSECMTKLLNVPFRKKEE